MDFQSIVVEFNNFAQDFLLSEVSWFLNSSRINVVDEGVILVTPGIFQDFEKSTDNHPGLDWKKIQQKVFKKHWHVRNEKKLNVIKFNVKGKKRSVTMNAVLFHDVSLAFGEQTPPDSNPHLEKF